MLKVNVKKISISKVNVTVETENEVLKVEIEKWFGEFGTYQISANATDKDGYIFKECLEGIEDLEHLKECMRIDFNYLLDLSKSYILRDIIVAFKQAETTINENDLIYHTQMILDDMATTADLNGMELTENVEDMMKKFKNEEDEEDYYNRVIEYLMKYTEL